MVVGRWTRGRATALATLVAGTLDIAVAMALSGMPAQRLLQTIASALIGDAAFAGGWAAALGGLVLHYVIALAMVAVFMLELAPRRSILRRPYLSAMLYGAGLWALMYLVVLPLRWPSRYPSLSPAATGVQLFCHIVLVGGAIGWATNRLRR